MLAYFHKGQFFGFWQDQRHAMQGWAEETIKANGHKPNDVEIYDSPAVRNDESYYFDDEKRLVTSSGKTMQTIEGVERPVFTWNEPLELEKIYPAP